MRLRRWRLRVLANQLRTDLDFRTIYDVDPTDRVVHEEWFFTRTAAAKSGRAVSSPPLNRYEVDRP